MLKILNWIFRKYLREYLSKRVIKLSNATFIPDIEIVENNKAGRSILPQYREKIVHELTVEMWKQGLVRIERRSNAELAGETMIASIYIFKSPKDRNKLGRG